MSNWLGVVSRDHVRRGVELGIAQVDHGKRSALARMGEGDHLVYYSPKTSRAGGERLQAFTALGRVCDDDLWQADEGAFKPWRRRVAFDRDAHDVPLGELTDTLDLTSAANWGYQLRRGLVELSDHDLDVIASAMRA
ncbi:MAG: EVE domain-containing protein [Nocardioidaceae bacterium]